MRSKTQYPNDTTSLPHHPPATAISSKQGSDDKPTRHLRAGVFPTQSRRALPFSWLDFLLWLFLSLSIYSQQHPTPYNTPVDSDKQYQGKSAKTHPTRQFEQAGFLRKKAGAALLLLLLRISSQKTPSPIQHHLPATATANKESSDDKSTRHLDQAGFL